MACLVTAYRMARTPGPSPSRKHHDAQHSWQTHREAGWYMAGTAALRATLDDAPDDGPIEAVLDSDRNLISDRDLIHGCRAGESEAWETLVGKYERLVYSIPLNCGL